MATPRIPSAVWSPLGPIPVVKKKGLVENDDAFGMFSGQKRQVSLDAENIPSLNAQTLFHELTHVALWDSGIQNTLTHEQTESICDAIGAYFGGMMLAGCLTIKAPKE